MTTTRHLHAVQDTPPPTVNVDPAQSEALIFAFNIAATKDNPEALDDLLAQALATHGVHEFAKLAAATLKHLATNTIGPVLSIHSPEVHP